MKKILSQRITAALLSTAMFSVLLPTAYCADGDAYIYCAAYYDNEGVLIGTKGINGSLSASEVDALVDIYEPEGAKTAKVFEWTDKLEPINDSGRAIDISDSGNSVVILHTNDMHGSLVGTSFVIGSDSVAALKKLDDAVLVDGGDAVQGVALASQSEGESVITVMNAAGYDVMAAGNHEFDYGIEQFAKLRDMAEFPIISANTYVGGKPMCAKEGKTNGENIIIEKNGVKIGIFALTTKSTMTSTKPENLTGVEFKDEIETAKAQTAALDAQGADAIIALTHMGTTDEGECTSRKLAEAMAGTELNAIIDGHSHSVDNEQVGGITIAQTGTGSVNVGRMEITVGENDEVSVNETMLSRTFFNNITPDEDVTKVINDVSADLNEKLKQEIGDNANTLWGGGLKNSANGASIAEGRVGETNFGSLISDAMIAEAEKIVPAAYKDLPIVAIENGGGYRASVPNGKITTGHIINALPYANTVMIKEITPAILYKALEGYISSVTAQDAETGFLTAGYSGSFPQIGGMRFSYDPNKPEGEKLTRVSLIGGDADLDKNDNDTKLILASNDYVIGQGEFKDIPMIAEGSGLVEAVIDYINTLTKNGTEPLAIPVTSGRITTDGDYAPKDYTAHIKLINAENLVNGDTLAVYVDGAAYEKGGVVRDGLLDIELPDGAHAIKLFPEQAEVYVNNYSGNGVIDVYGDLNLGYPELQYDAEKAANPIG